MYRYSEPVRDPAPLRYDQRSGSEHAAATEGQFDRAAGFDPASLTVDYDAPLNLDDYQQHWDVNPAPSTFTLPHPTSLPPPSAISATYDPYAPLHYSTEPYLNPSTSQPPFSAPAPAPPQHALSFSYAPELPDYNFDPYHHDPTIQDNWVFETVDEVYNPHAPFLFENTPARYHPPTYPLLEAPIDTYYPPPPPPPLPHHHLSDPTPRPSSSIYRSPPLAPARAATFAAVATSHHRTSSQPPSRSHRSYRSPDLDLQPPTTTSAPATPAQPLRTSSGGAPATAGRGRPLTTRPQSHQDVPALSEESWSALEKALSDRSLQNSVALSSVAHDLSSRSSSVNSARPRGGGGKFVVTRGGGSAKAKMDVSATCWTCGDLIARLVLRGSRVETMIPRLSATCIACVPLADDTVSSSSSSQARPGTETPVRPQDSATYFDTMSAAIDALDGLQISDELMGRPVDGPQPELPETLKDQAFTCDVCARIVGAGTIRAFVDGQPTSFTTEVICARCDDMYQPCSDCGGGGGRLTPGRWRCKELFPNGRKTCNLSHARLPTLDEISTEVFHIDEIPQHSLPALEARCRQLFFNARLGTIARPEYLSKGDGLATTYAQIERITIDSWNLVLPYMRPASDPLMRRYIALNYSTPQRRKMRSINEPLPENAQRVVTGFYFMEVDLRHGVTFFSATAPWVTSGLAYDCSSHLGTVATARVKADLIKLNQKRQAQGLTPFPRISKHFLLAPFKSDSRITQTLERRGYSTFDDHILEYPDTPLEAFPPLRSVWVPNQFLHAWTVHVLHLADEKDLGAPPVKTRRRKPKRAVEP